MELFKTLGTSLLCERAAQRLLCRFVEPIETAYYAQQSRHDWFRVQHPRPQLSASVW